MYSCFDALVSLLFNEKTHFVMVRIPITLVVSWVHHVESPSLGGEIFPFRQLSNRFPIGFPLQAFASAILAIFAVSLEWWWHTQRWNVLPLWDEHMEDLLDIRTGTQSSELLNAVDSAFWKRLKRKC